MPAHHRAQIRQGRPEFLHPVVLIPVSLFPPQVVIPVLAAPRRVSANGLDVAQRVGADPDVFPRGGNDQRPDPGQRPLIRDRRVRAEVPEASPAAPAPDPASAKVTAPEPKRQGTWRGRSNASVIAPTACSAALGSALPPCSVFALTNALPRNAAGKVVKFRRLRARERPSRNEEPGKG